MKTKRVLRILKLAEKHGLSLDHGLNSWSLNGWTFEVYSDTPKNVKTEMSNLLKLVSNQETETLKKELYG